MDTGTPRQIGRCSDWRAVAPAREWNADNESTLPSKSRKLTKNMEVDMLNDEIRRTPAKVLTEEQRESYWENGYLLLEGSSQTSGWSACARRPTRWSSAAVR